MASAKPWRTSSNSLAMVSDIETGCAGLARVESRLLGSMRDLCEGCVWGGARSCYQHERAPLRVSVFDRQRDLRPLATQWRGIGHQEERVLDEADGLTAAPPGLKDPQLGVFAQALLDVFGGAGTVVDAMGHRFGRATE